MKVQMVIESNKRFSIRLYPETTMEKSMVELASVPGEVGNLQRKVGVFKPDTASVNNPEGQAYLQIEVE